MAFLLAFLMALVHFLGEELESYISGYREQIVSFSAGASITYIFVQLLPEFHRVATESSELIFVFPLLGFSSIHLLEKYLAKSDIEGEKMRRDYGEIHSGFLFLYHGAIGYLIASLLAESAVSGLLFFLPIILHVAVSSFSVTELHEDFVRRETVKVLISVAPVLGALIHRIGAVASHHFNPIFGTVIGMFFFIVVRDSIPREERGKPTEYLIGMVIYLAVIIMAKTI
ncbi:MAG: hypothetical protein ABEJ07_06245 [Candidatus Nanohaloarchaea archaeon]